MRRRRYFMTNAHLYCSVHTWVWFTSYVFLRLCLRVAETPKREDAPAVSDAASKLSITSFDLFSTVWSTRSTLLQFKRLSAFSLYHQMTLLSWSFNGKIRKKFSWQLSIFHKIHIFYKSIENGLSMESCDKKESKKNKICSLELTRRYYVE